MKKTINSLWTRSLENFPNNIAICERQSKKVKDKDSGKVTEEISYVKHTYLDVENMVLKLGAGLIELNVQEKTPIGIIAENSLRWMVADLAIMGNRSYNVPRGISTTARELQYLLNHSEVKILFVENEEILRKVDKIRDDLPDLQSIVVLDPNYQKTSALEEEFGHHFTYDEVLIMGEKHLHHVKSFLNRRSEAEEDDVVTIMYSSGTTGIPKGVPLTQRNFYHNLENVPKAIEIKEKDRFLSILPIWHVFERTLDYVVLVQGASLWYTTQLTIVKDLSVVNPMFLVSVPRIWISVYNSVQTQLKRTKKLALFQYFYKHTLKVMEYKRYKEQRQFLKIGEKEHKVKATLQDHAIHFVADKIIYSKIRAKLGNSFVAGVSGGGSLPAYVDDFFEAIGVHILDCYGLTETSPGICGRRMERKVPYTVGRPFDHTFVKIANDEGEELPSGEKGNLFVFGPQVMNGYYKDPESTAKVMKLDDSGRRWFNTGDIAIITKYGDVKILGREKDIIVLNNGENIGPEKIEMAIMASDYIDQVMVCGQDQESITALIVPNQELFIRFCNENSIRFDHNFEKISELSENKLLKDFFMSEIRKRVNEREGFQEIEYVTNIAFTKPFSTEDQTMTNTLKIKRHQIEERDYEIIKKMYVRFTVINK